MERKYLVSILGLLTMAGLVFGQPSEAPTPTPLLGMNGGPPLAAGEGVPSFPEPCGRPVRPWFLTSTAEYLLWFIQSEDIGNAQVSTNQFTLTPAANPFSRRNLEDRPLSGGRITLGYWMADNDDPVLEPGFNPALWGVEGSAFFLGERSFNFLSGPSPILIRPFFNLNDQTPSATIVAFPGIASGQLFGTANFDLWGAELNYWKNVYKNPPAQFMRLDVMAGFRYLEFETGLRIGQNSFFEAPLFTTPILPGDRLDVFDSFNTRNQYYGGQVGLGVKLLLGCTTFSTNLKYGIGNNHQVIIIDGSQTLTRGTTETKFVGGLLALPSNIGLHSRNRFTQLPEADLNLSINLTERMSFQLGYMFMYLNRVVRAGSQIDRVIDISQIPNFPGGAFAVPTGLGRPAVLFQERGLLVHGVNIGLKFAW